MRRVSAWVVFALALVAMLPAGAAAKGGAGDRTAAQNALQRAADLRHGIGVRSGRELTPALAELTARRDALDSAGRRQADALLARPTDGNSDPQGDGYSVAEAAPVCVAHFCIHYVATTADAPPAADTTPANGIPDYVEQMASVFEDEVFPCENGAAVLACAEAGTAGLGWPEAPSDGTRGGNAKFDVYLKQLGNQGIFGYVAPDPQAAGSSLFSYLVMDNDFSFAEFGYPDPLLPMRVTAAHEYNHVLQFGIDANEDTWMFESTATWAEEKVYPTIDDYLNYMGTWVDSTADPLTDAAGGGGLKIYGSAVWNHFVAGRHGDATILDAWQASTVVNGGPFAPASYSTALAANGGTGFSDEFDDFSAAVAEWRAPGSGFPDLYPDVPAVARPSMTIGAAATTISLDHTTFKFRNVAPPASSATLTFTATLPAGLKGAIALVGRTGNSTTAGTVTKQIQRLSNGGAASVSLPNADTYGRITAVLVNADPTQSGFNQGKGDWTFTKDKQSFTGVRVTSAAPPPAPAASTSAATQIGATSAQLNGTVDPNGAATTYWFEYGTTTTYGTQVPLAPASAGSGSGAVAVSATPAGLTRGQTYHFRVVAQSAGGTTAGGDQTFRTLDPPVVTTAAATDIGVDGATLNATVNPRGQSTSYAFQYGTTTAYGSQVPATAAPAGSGSSPVPVSAGLTGVARGTTIHYRVVATNADGASVGGDRTFTTLDPPVATTGDAGAVTASSATLTGSVNPRGKATTFRFEYGTSTAYGSEVTGSAGSSTAAVSLATQVAGLTADTVYHFRLSATNADGTTVGSDGTFKTAAATGTGTTGTTGTTGGTAGTTGTTGTTGTADGGGGGFATTPPLTVTVAVVRAKLARALSNGLRVRAGCARVCNLSVKLVLPAKVAKKLRLKRTVGSTRRSSGPTPATVTVRFSKKARAALSRLRRVSLSVVVTATSADGARATATKRLTLRR